MARPSTSSMPSSSTAGFFQAPPELGNQFYEDTAFGRIFEFRLPHTIQAAISHDLSRFSSLIIQPHVLSWVADAEHNPPYLRTWDTWGRRRDELVTSEGWRNLQALGIREGIVAIPYENQHGQYSRLYQFLKYHLWSGSCATVTCPSAMTDGAARLLSQHIARKETAEADKAVFEAAYGRLTSRDPTQAWTSGQWMTERAGGSDVRGTETQATYLPLQGGSNATDTTGQPLGPWAVSGFKWFSSATDSQMTVLLAKTPSGGVSAFYAPMRRSTISTTLDKHRGAKSGLDTSTLTPTTATALPATASSANTELNGITIQRLKFKLGTRPLPTAELVLHDTRAYLLGTEGQGTKEISTVLNITRVHNAVSAVGFWARGLAISRAFARVRRTGGRLLRDVPAHVKTMARGAVEYKASMQLAFFVVALLGIVEQGDGTGGVAAVGGMEMDHARATHLLRLLTPLAKALTAKAAIAGLAECMESLGGVGYLENEDMSVNVARLFRDANVLSIWEGTTDVMAEDVVRVVKGRAGGEVLGAFKGWVEAALRRWKGDEQADRFAGAVDSAMAGFIGMAKSSGVEELKYRAREMLQTLGWIVCALLLIEDARRDGNNVAMEVARRWIGKRADGSSLVEQKSWHAEFELDRRIVFGDIEEGVEGRAKL